MEGGHVPVQGDGPADVLGGNRVLARLGGNHAQEVQRVGVIRRDSQNLPVDLLGRLQPAGLMVSDRNR